MEKPLQLKQGNSDKTPGVLRYPLEKRSCFLIKRCNHYQQLQPSKPSPVTIAQFLSLMLCLQHNQTKPASDSLFSLHIIYKYLFPPLILAYNSLSLNLASSRSVTCFRFDILDLHATRTESSLLLT